MTAVDRALRLLARKARTEKEMHLALEKAGVSEGERAEAVARLRELGYMDDMEVARGRARTLLGRGRLRGSPSAGSVSREWARRKRAPRWPSRRRGRRRRSY